MSEVDLLDYFHEEETKSEPPVSRAIKSFVSKWPNQPTDTDILRASGMYFLCPREFVLNYWRPQPNKVFDATARVKMHMGTDFHDYMQNRILGPMGVLFGTWVYRYNEMHTEVGFHPDPHRAISEMQNQLPLTWTYKEATVWDEEYRIRGHFDGAVCPNRLAEANKIYRRHGLIEAFKELRDMPVEKHKLLEIKTGTAYAQKALTDAKSIPPYYQMQASIYMWLAGFTEAVFLFAERDGFTMKTISYEVEDKWLRDAKRKARVIWRSIKNRTIPESGMKCISPTDKRAKSCVHSSPCFADCDWETWIEESIAMQPDRKWLDLSDWSDDDG